MTPEAAKLVAALDGPMRPSSDFDLNPDVVLPEGRTLKPAAVLIALAPQDGEVRVILTKRASHLKHHPGQIAFPGGKVDPGDADPTAAALREAREEIGLNTAVTLGTLPAHETVTGYQITPVLAEITPLFAPVPEPAEVDEVFAVPLTFLMDRGNFRVERRRWRGSWRSYYAVPYGPYYIWGATARILRALADAVAE